MVRSQNVLSQCETGPVIERVVAFDRPRRMRCGSCNFEWDVDAEWLYRFDRVEEACPSCGTDCQVEDRPDFWFSPDDPLHEDSRVRETYWYHTSTYVNWPQRAFDPTIRSTDTTNPKYQHVKSGELAPGRWAQGQKAKALHLGTYEAAIENMLRRMTKQGNAGDQFYLYRVRLSPDAVIEPGVHKEPTNFVGDVQLSEICAPGVNTFRYINTHEDPSSISLAVTLDAIQAVQGIPIPLPVSATHPWVNTASSRLREAASRPSPQPMTALDRLRRPVSPALSEARNLEAEIAGTLPLALRRRLYVRFDEADITTDRHAFPAKLIGLANLVTEPTATLELLDGAPWREV